MKRFIELRQSIDLVEKVAGPIVVTFGRFQPPTTGHKKLIDAVVKTARQNGAAHRIYFSRSYDAKSNPLKPEKKYTIMKMLFPKANIVNDSTAITPFHALKRLSNEGYRDVIFVVGCDRVREIEKSVRKYINHKDPQKSFDFDTFHVVCAGERDPDAEDVTGMSGTKMRRAASENDFELFLTGVPSRNVAVAKTVFDEVRRGMGLR